MDELIRDFPNQLAEAIKLGQEVNLTPAATPIHQVVVAGMGGSAIGGILVKQWVADQLVIPMEVNQDYTLPAYVNQHTLLIVVSYSGNTEETIEAFQAGIEKQAKIICITADGILKELAHKHRIDWIPLPAGRPPRACLDHTAVILLFILRFYGLIAWDFVADLQAAIQLLRQSEFDIQAKAQQIAREIQGKLPVIYATAPYEGVAMRFRQQLNENSKQLCWHHVIPALNHNEIVGWQDPDCRLVVLMLYGTQMHGRIELQQAITRRIIESQTRHFIVIKAPGKTHLSDTLFLINLNDWVSLYLAQLKAIDPLAVKNIDQIKFGLSNCN
jgi:glucose/mannose-6-phosphate isomerase